MRIIDITHPPKDLWVGRESENRFRPVSFECANWFEAYPNATIVAYYQPYAASDPYPLVLSVDGTKRIWHPTATELVKGNGELQIVLMLGDVVGTSAIIPTKVERSLISNSDHPASEAPSWTVQVVEDVTEQADRAEEAADSIGGAIDEAVAEAVPTAVADYIEEHPIEVTETDPTVPAWAKEPTKPSYTAAEVHALPDTTVIPDISSKVDKVAGKGLSTNDFTNADKAKLDGIESGAQKNTVTSVNGMTGDVVVSGGGAVSSVNGKTGAVVLNAADVNALPSNTTIPTKTSDLTNDSGFQTAPFEIPIIGSDGNYTTTATAQEIYDNAENCVIALGIYRYTTTRVVKDASNEFVNIHVNVATGTNSNLYVAKIQIHAELPSTVTITVQEKGFLTLPAVTSDDNGKFLRVVSGAWAAETVSTWQGGSY